MCILLRLQYGVRWFVGHLTELLTALAELDGRRQQQQQQGRPQQQRICLQQLVIRDAEGAPEHWRWLLLAGTDTAAAADAADSTSANGSSARHSKRQQQAHLWVPSIITPKTPQPLLSNVPRLVLSECSRLSGSLVKEYVQQAAADTSQNGTTAVAAGSRPSLRRSRGAWGVGVRQQLQHAIALAGCEGVTSYDCVKHSNMLGECRMEVAWLPKAYRE